MVLAADVIDNIIKLLRSAKDDADMLMEKSDDRKPGIIKYFYINGLEDGWKLMTIYFPGIVRKLIFYEVIDYCKHRLECSTESESDGDDEESESDGDDENYADKDPKFFAQWSNELDDDMIFNLIMECIQYCRKAFANGDLIFEFNILVDTLKTMTTKQTVQANIGSTPMDRKSIDGFPDSLLKTLLLP